MDQKTSTSNEQQVDGTQYNTSHDLKNETHNSIKLIIIEIFHQLKLLSKKSESECHRTSFRMFHSNNIFDDG